jgi:tetratricopeptide (TPR) repeat protein
MVAAGSRLVAARRAATNSALLVTAAAAAGPTESKRAAIQAEGSLVAAPAIVPAAEAPEAAVVAPPTEPRHTRRVAAAAAPSVTGQTPQDMLQKANDLRAQHQWFAATQLYEQTIRTFPKRAEAYSAAVAAGVLRLDQLGDGRGALDLFSSALRARPRGALSEEARWGVIQSYRALGDRASERARLQEFVMLYPQSLLAPRAHARRRALDAETPSTL